MAFADSNRTGLSYIVEVAWDAIPATPTYIYTRYTGESLNFNISNETTKEIRNDSNITDLIQIGAESAGGWTFEFSYENPSDVILEGALRSGAFPTDLSSAIAAVATIEVTSGNIYNASTGTPFATINVGDWIRVKGFTDPANNGYKLVTAVTSNVNITVAQTLVVEAEGDSITMYGTSIRNGTTDKSFSIMRQHDDVSEFFNWSGMTINSFGVEVAANAIATGSVDFMGGTATSQGTTFSTSGTPTAAPSNDVYSSVSDVGTIYFDGVESTLEFMNLSFTINNNLRGKPAIGTLGNIEIGKGFFEVTGSFSTYFENNDLYTKFVNATEFSLHFGLHSDVDTPTSSDSYIFSFPRCKIETDSGPQAGSQNQDLMEDVTFRAIFSPATASNCTMLITKILAG